MNGLVWTNNVTMPSEKYTTTLPSGLVVTTILNYEKIDKDAVPYNSLEATINKYITKKLENIENIGMEIVGSQFKPEAYSVNDEIEKKIRKYHGDTIEHIHVKTYIPFQKSVVRKTFQIDEWSLPVIVKIYYQGILNQDAESLVRQAWNPKNILSGKYSNLQKRIIYNRKRKDTYYVDPSRVITFSIKLDEDPSKLIEQLNKYNSVDIPWSKIMPYFFGLLYLLSNSMIEESKRTKQNLLDKFMGCGLVLAFWILGALLCNIGFETFVLHPSRISYLFMYFLCTLIGIFTGPISVVVGIASTI